MEFGAWSVLAASVHQALSELLSVKYNTTEANNNLMLLNLTCYVAGSVNGNRVASL